MKRILYASAVLGMLLIGSNSVHAGPFGYKLDVTTAYDSFGDADPNFNPNPDSSSITVTNNGTTTFTGTISNVAVSNFSGNTDYSRSFPGLTFAPGASFQFSTSDESSNKGGFNGPTGTVQPGITLNINGFINGTEAVALTVNDADIHSGVINGEGLTDAYVLQGGDPFGNDNGDGIEESQAPGHFEFLELPSGVTPEPASLTLLAFGIVGIVGYGWRKRKSAAA